MQPRSRIRGRDPPPPGGGGGGRYRRRSPPPPSPRYQRRARDAPPPQTHTQRRSPDRPPPRRYEENPLPDAAAAADRRARADILLEAGRLAAHYLVAQGVLPEHVLQVRENPNHTVSRLEPPAPPPAPVGYERKRDDDEDPRWRRGGGSAGDWGRGKGDDDRQDRRSGWDRRSHSFDGRRKYNDGGGGDVDRGGRRARDYNEPKRPPMSRSYSHNDRRASGDGRLDRRRRSRSRSRSRSRTRTRSHYGGSRRDSDWRAGSRDLDHTKGRDSGIVLAADADAGEMPRQPRVPSSVVVAEVNDSAGQAMATEDGEMASQVVGLDHTEDISEDEDGEFAEDISEEEDGELAVSDLNNEDGGEMDVTPHQLSDVDVHPSEPVEESVHTQTQPESAEESVHMQTQLNNVEEGTEARFAHMDVHTVEPLVENNGCSEVGDEMEAPQSEVETGVGDINRDEQDLPAWYRIFDLNVVETPEGCEISEISGNPPADLVSSLVPDLVGQVNQQANCDTSEIQGQDDHAGDNHMVEDGHDLSYDLNNEADEHAQDDISEIEGQDEHEGDNQLLDDGHDLNKYDLNNEADEYAQDNHLLNNEEILLSHGRVVHNLDSCHLSNEQMILKQNADEQEHDNHLTENEQVLINQGTAVHVLDSLHVNDEHSPLSHRVEEHRDDDGPEPALLPMGVHELDRYDLNGEQMLRSNGAEKHAAYSCYVKEEQILLAQAVDRQPRVHDMGNGRTTPVINLEDDCQDQSDTREFLESKSEISHNYTDNVLQEHASSQDQQTPSFPDNPHQINIQPASSSSITPNSGNRCTGRVAVNAQGIPSDDDALYGAFDKLPLEAINIWDLPSSELGKS